MCVTVVMFVVEAGAVLSRFLPGASIHLSAAMSVGYQLFPFTGNFPLWADISCGLQMEWEAMLSTITVLQPLTESNQ